MISLQSGLSHSYSLPERRPSQKVPISRCVENPNFELGTPPSHKKKQRKPHVKSRTGCLTCRFAAVASCIGIQKADLVQDSTGEMRRGKTNVPALSQF